MINGCIGLSYELQLGDFRDDGHELIHRLSFYSTSPPAPCRGQKQCYPGEFAPLVLFLGPLRPASARSHQAIALVGVLPRLRRAIAAAHGGRRTAQTRTIGASARSLSGQKEIVDSMI
jgi:hypothetical protein